VASREEENYMSLFYALSKIKVNGHELNNETKKKIKTYKGNTKAFDEEEGAGKMLIVVFSLACKYQTGSCMSFILNAT
jgi:hypothetical protein